MELRFPEYLSPVQRRKLHEKLKEKLRNDDDAALDILAEAMVNLIVSRFKNKGEAHDKEHPSHVQTDGEKEAAD